jgi:nicotinamidase-related amidase
LDIPVVATEQYPKGLGRTVPGLAESLEPGEAVEKTSFNAVREGRVAEAVAASRRRQIVLTGAEAHVCVLQTALGLKAQGYWPVVVSDAVASRAPESVEAAIRRLTANGIEVVTTEMVLFEWLGEAGTSDFKALLDLIK